MRVRRSLGVMDSIYRLCGDYFYSEISDGAIPTSRGCTTSTDATTTHIDAKIVNSLALVLDELRSNGRRTGENEIAHKLILKACCHSSIQNSVNAVCTRLGVRRGEAVSNISSTSHDSDDESSTSAASKSAENEEQLVVDDMQHDLYCLDFSGDDEDEGDDCDSETTSNQWN